MGLQERARRQQICLAGQCRFGSAAGISKPENCSCSAAVLTASTAAISVLCRPARSSGGRRRSQHGCSRATAFGDCCRHLRLDLSAPLTRRISLNKIKNRLRQRQFSSGVNATPDVKTISSFQGWYSVWAGPTQRPNVVARAGLYRSGEMACATEAPVKSRRLGPCGLRSLPQETAAITRRPPPSMKLGASDGLKWRTKPGQCRWAQSGWLRIGRLASLARGDVPAASLSCDSRRSCSAPLSFLTDATARLMIGAP